VNSYMDFPFQIDGTGRVATTGVDDHVRDMIYQVLFTSPGERVDLPNFGCGLLQLVFAPNSDVLAAATQLLVQGSLQKWLGDVIQVENLQVSNNDNQLVVSMVYTRRDTGQQQTTEFAVPTSNP
jgi:phage baseplate assembly protein W